MGKRKYRTVAAAVLVVAALFSPLLCGMNCLEGRGSKNRATGDFAGKLAESGAIGCVVVKLVWGMNAGDWESVLKVGMWIETGIQALKSARGVGNLAGEIIAS